MKQVFVAMTIVALSMGVTYDDGRTDGLVGEQETVGAALAGAVGVEGRDRQAVDGTVGEPEALGENACVTLVYVPAEYDSAGSVTYVAHYEAIDPLEGFRHGVAGDFVWWAFDQALTDDVLWDNEQFQSFEIDGQDRVVCDE